MGKLNAYLFTILNGYFESPKGNISWHTHAEEENEFAASRQGCVGNAPRAKVGRVEGLLLTYVVNLLRGLWTGQPWGRHLLDVGVLTGMLLLGGIISVKTFRWE